MGSNTECGMLIKRINDRIAQMSNNELRASELTLSQLRYLEYLYDQQDMEAHFKDLEAFFGVSQPTVVGVLKRLERKGLVSTQLSAAGGNVKTAHLTEKGKALYEDSRTYRNGVEQTLLVPLDAQEQAMFHEMLRKVCMHLEESQE